MINSLNTADTPENEIWHELIEMLLDEESDVEDIAYAASWLSLNFFALNQKVRNALTKRLNRPNEFQPVKILETIEYLFDEDRETEIILLIKLLQYAPNTYKQIKHVLWNPELSSPYRNAYMLLMDDEDWSDQPD